MRKQSTIADLVLADFREQSARNKRHKNQKDNRTSMQWLKDNFGKKSHKYRRDRVLLMLINLNMKATIARLMK